VLEEQIMLRVLAWMGLYVGAPSVGTYLSAAYLSFVDHFLVLFVISVTGLLIAILPRLAERAPS
jgi:hypothetical protein